MRRGFGVVVFLAAGVAASFALASARASTSHSAKPCSTTDPSYVQANLSWGVECLHAGEFCKVGNTEYRAYGFDCPYGRLTYYRTTTIPTATTNSTVTPPSTTTTNAATTSQSAPPSITTLTALGKTHPRPLTGQKAVALVRTNPDTNQAASPFAHELAWVAQWRGDRWWLVGLFSSESGTRFVVDASIESGKVYTYIDYASRPSAAWVRSTTRRWKLRTLYTRLTPAAATGLVQHVVSQTEYTILGSAAKLAVDTAEKIGWYFVFYVRRTSDSAKLVLVVDGLGGGDPVEEGNYTSGYGFGGQPTVETSVPLNLSDWVRAVAQANRWTPNNLP